ncbi:MAG: ATP-binding cassette domain-containing protein [Thermococcus sp.]|uniref:energy-coupling factor ABC transporter ATP-binding protein n=1 Tax=Thermococcus sp. TaxID=35749 RepID=UPI000BDAF046|nr:ATP-binding cassette domain-containing protein [Thermococcus sp.]OYT32738.1 MAG: energy-coupling factor ABC transporter ATP-binding protein [Archaeoglobales archaeon ex4484_92]RLF75360.1 MAG: ABC transporter ATP-binding protein [Thermococci archaeon]MCD6139696.1 ATP-binding cassette domain-containing protein [Thermococcus sp.]MCD6143358.1 ATP-binding cassette domain-containing protein [Thermococcus sp.]RLF85808.1 MAG: ABC transporter ATP-binding protein [Thermococci archaeon]
MIRVEELSFKYTGAKEYSLKNINLKVKKGEFLGILGASGSGKSTLCLTFNGIIPHSIKGEFNGNVFVQGYNTKEASVAELSKLVGLVLQNPDSQLFNMTVEEEVAFSLENLGLDVEEIRRRVYWSLKITGLEGLEKEFPPNLSGGQKQRLVIASVLAMRPQILVLDEPTSQLDPLGREQVLSLITLLNKEQGITIILVEHNTEYLFDFADRLIVLDKGELVMEGKPREVFEEADFLRSLGIKIPTSVKIGAELKKKGLLERAALNDKELVDAIRTFLKG